MGGARVAAPPSSDGPADRLNPPVSVGIDSSVTKLAADPRLCDRRGEVPR